MKEKKKKTIRKILIAFIVILAVLAGGVLFALTHTQIIVGTIQHCFVASERVNDVARDAFDRMITFIKVRRIDFGKGQKTDMRKQLICLSPELYHYYRDSVCHRAGTLSALW